MGQRDINPRRMSSCWRAINRSRSCDLSLRSFELGTDLDRGMSDCRKKNLRFAEVGRRIEGGWCGGDQVTRTALGECLLLFAISLRHVLRQLLAGEEGFEFGEAEAAADEGNAHPVFADERGGVLEEVIGDVLAVGRDPV